MIHLVHGIRSTAASPVAGLIPFLPAPVAFPDYGWIEELETRIVNPIIVGALLPYIQAGDVLVGHSNGCAIAYELLRQGAPARGAIFINAALNASVERPNATVQWIDVYSNRGDQVTELAKAGAIIGLTDPEWGEMGHSGYSGDDPLFTNIFCDTYRNMPVVCGHSDIFTPANLSAWGPFIASRIR